MSIPTIPEVIRKNNAGFITDNKGETIVNQTPLDYTPTDEDLAVNEYAVTPDFRDDAEGVTEYQLDEEGFQQYDASDIASDDFDILGAIAAIAAGDAEFRATDEEGQAFLNGIEHAFTAGVMFASIFGEEIEDDPSLVRMGFQTYALAQLAIAGRDE